MITFDQVRASARKVVEARGADFAYVSENRDHYEQILTCAYVPAADPRFPYPADQAVSGAQITGCLVGEILKDLGLLTDGVARSKLPVQNLIHSGQMPSYAIEYLRRMQVSQDQGWTWGEALRKAELQAEREGPYVA